MKYIIAEILWPWQSSLLLFDEEKNKLLCKYNSIDIHVNQRCIQRGFQISHVPTFYSSISSC